MKSGLFVSTAIRGLLLTLLLSAASTAIAQPTFTKSFEFPTIGPGSTTGLIFTISNASGSPVEQLAFTDILPAGVTIADPANVTNGCGGSLTAPNGGGTITLSGGSVAAGQSCQIIVDTTASMPGTFMNVSGDLTSDAGNSGTATADLTVATDRPGFTKSFAPDSIQIGERSSLVFTVDNSLNANSLFNITFNDSLQGLQVADPSNASSTCGGGVVNATPGGTSINYGPAFGGDATLAAGATCTVTVDVVGDSVGVQVNETSNLSAFSGVSNLSSGKATDTITVTANGFQKSFLDDPVAPGGTVTLEFQISNLSRNDAISDLSFTDDLNATLAGLAATGLPANDVCGTGSQLSGTTLLSLTGGNLAPEEVCTFQVTLQVPAGATPGTYPNTTSTATFNQGGSPGSFSPASDSLFINEAPVLTKTFLTNPISGGDPVTMEFTITNSSTTSTATDITFTDNLTQFVGSASVSSLPAAGFCGGGSNAFAFTVTGELILNVTGANLAAGASCTFQVGLSIPPGSPNGDFVNTTSDISATVDGTTQTGNAASDTLSILGLPELNQSAVPNTVQPGDTFDIEITLSLAGENALGATDLTFTENLDGVLTGLTAVNTPLTDICGVGSQISGTTALTFTGGSLEPGDSCSFNVTVQVPAAASIGTYNLNKTGYQGTVDGQTVLGPNVSTPFTVSELIFTKEFVDDPAFKGDNVTLQFTIDNQSAADATGISFTDRLSDALTGLTVDAGSVPANPCGAGSSITLLSGNTLVSFNGGNLLAGTFCTFDLTVVVPAGAIAGTYTNVTSNITATVGGNPVVDEPAIDDLIVQDSLLFSKTFTDDPVAPGDSVTLEFTITNQNTADTATNLAFTDDLDAALSGLVATGLPVSDVCGAGSQISGNSTITLTGGNLAANASCTFAVTLQVPAATPLGTDAINTTSSLTGTVGGIAETAPPASDTLELNRVSLSKTLSDPVQAGDQVTLMFLLTNEDSTSPISNVQFTDDLDAMLAGATALGLPINDVCGTGSQLSGTSVVQLTGGSLDASGTCSFSIQVQTPAAALSGDYINTTSDITVDGLITGDPATDTLTVLRAPGFSKVFAPDTLTENSITTLTFTIDNTGGNEDATNLDLRDVLPLGNQVANPSNASTTCTGGTITATPGSDVIEYNGGTVVAGTTCTLTVDVLARVTGSYTNITDALTSSQGNSGMATAPLTVALNLPGFTKAFSPTTVEPGEPTNVTLTIDNTVNNSTVTGLDVTDNLPAGLEIAPSPNASTNCTGGTVTAVAGTTSANYTGGSVPGGITCLVQFDVIATSVGMFTNTTGSLTSSAGDSGTASDMVTASFALPTVAKSFNPTTVEPGQPSTVTLTFDNTANDFPVDNVDITDNLPAGMIVDDAGGAFNNCQGGTLTATPSSGSFSYTGGTLPGGSTCTIEVTVETTMTGSFINTTGDLTSAAGNSGSASATLTAGFGLPGITKSFAPAVILPGEVSAVTLTIDNTVNNFAVGSLAISDNLPAGMTVAATPNAMTSCLGGTLTASAGSGSVTYTGGSVPGASMCTISFDVTVGSAGSFTNTTSDLISDAGNSGGASAVLNASGGADFSKTFTPNVVAPGETMQLDFVISNPSGSTMISQAAFTDDLASVLDGLTVTTSLPVNDVCGSGSVLSNIGTAQDPILSLTDGNVGASGSCQFGVTVSVPAGAPTGTYTNTSSELTYQIDDVVVQKAGSNLISPAGVANATTAPATAQFDVVGVTLVKSFSPSVAQPGGIITLDFQITNPSNVDATNVSFTDDLDAMLAGATATNLPLSDICGLGSTLSGTSLVTLTGGNLTAGTSCSFSVQVAIPFDALPGTVTNITSPVSGDFGGQAIAGTAGAAASAPLGIAITLERVPTLSSVGLLALAILFGMFGWVAIRRKTA